MEEKREKKVPSCITICREIEAVAVEHGIEYAKVEKAVGLQLLIDISDALQIKNELIAESNLNQEKSKEIFDKQILPLIEEVFGDKDTSDNSVTEIDMTDLDEPTEYEKHMKEKSEAFHKKEPAQNAKAENPQAKPGYPKQENSTIQESEENAANDE